MSRESPPCRHPSGRVRAGHQHGSKQGRAAPCRCHEAAAEEGPGDPRDVRRQFADAGSRFRISFWRRRPSWPLGHTGVGLHFPNACVSSVRDIASDLDCSGTKQGQSSYRPPFRVGSGACDARTVSPRPFICLEEGPWGSRLIWKSPRAPTVMWKLAAPWCFDSVQPLERVHVGCDFAYNRSPSGPGLSRRSASEAVEGLFHPENSIN
jgi:hypothetical protein